MYVRAHTQHARACNHEEATQTSLSPIFVVGEEGIQCSSAGESHGTLVDPRLSQYLGKDTKNPQRQTSEHTWSNRRRTPHHNDEVTAHSCTCMCTHIYTQIHPHFHKKHACRQTHVFAQRERERVGHNTYTHIYIYTHVHTERERFSRNETFSHEMSTSRDLVREDASEGVHAERSSVRE